MSEGFDLGAFHVPQQSRRDKLRSLEGLHSAVYDPIGDSFNIHPALSLHPSHHHHHIKDEGLNLMGFGQTTINVDRNDPFFSSSSSTCSSSSSSTSSSSHLLFDLPPSLSINPGTTTPHVNPFLYAAAPDQHHHHQQQQHQQHGPSAGFRDFNIQPPLFKPSHSFPVGPHSSVLTTQGLSLSLSSSHTFNNGAGDGSLLVDKGGYVVIGGGGGGSGGGGDVVSRTAGPLGPFTGYAEVLKGSRFLKPAQQLLQDYCNVGQGAYLEKISAMDHHVEMERMSDSEIIDDPVGVGSSADSGEFRRKKTRLITMLDEVYRRYKQYYQQMQAVVASFESVHGLSMAAPFTSLALKTLSKHFRCLKDAINDQLRKAIGEESFGKDDVPKFRIIDHSVHHQRAAHSSGILDQPHIWRPQRGLPERAVAVLRAWLFEHFLHPYPTDTDKQMLAKQTGLSRNQVSNWFINARVRLWKPMVEEIHSLEMSQGQKVSEGEGLQNANKQSSAAHVDPIPTSSEPFQDSSIKRNPGDISGKRCGNELAEIPNGSGHSMNFSYDSMANHHLHPVGVGVSVAGGNAGVSLTLGLHQNNVACLSEPLPLAVPHFGALEESNNAYGFGGFDNQSRQLRRDLGGHFLHDFVG